MAWVFLFISVIFEVSWVSTLKATAGYSRLLPSVLNFALGIGGVLSLSQAVKTLPLSIAYCVWTGLSAVSIVIIGKVFLGDQLGMIQIGFIAMIIIGIVGLKFFSAA